MRPSVVRGENASSSSSSARRDIDIALQADDAPLEGSLLGLAGSVLVLSASGNSTGGSNNDSSMKKTVRIVGVTQVDSDYAVQAHTLPTSTSVVPTTTRAVRTGECPSGQFNPDPYTCAPCPWGFWCPPGAAAAVAGLAGTYAPSTGAPVCMACPPGRYCTGAAAAPTTCPAHTSSSAGASSLLDCACDADYACTYARSVTLRLKLDTELSVQALQSDAGIVSTLNGAFLMALGLYGAPGVTATFKGFVPVMT
jgi:hypothetical protein